MTDRSSAVSTAAAAAAAAAVRSPPRIVQIDELRRAIEECAHKCEIMQRASEDDEHRQMHTPQRQSDAAHSNGATVAAAAAAADPAHERSPDTPTTAHATSNTPHRTAAAIEPVAAPVARVPPSLPAASSVDSLRAQLAQLQAELRASERATAAGAAAEKDELDRAALRSSSSSLSLSQHQQHPQWDRIDRLQSELRSTQSKLASAQSDLAEARQSLSRTEDALQSTQDRLAATEARLSQSQSQRSALQSELYALRQAHDDELAHLRSKHDAALRRESDRARRAEHQNPLHDDTQYSSSIVDELQSKLARAQDRIRILERQLRDMRDLQAEEAALGASSFASPNNRYASPSQQPQQQHRSHNDRSSRFTSPVSASSAATAASAFDRSLAFDPSEELARLQSSYAHLVEQVAHQKTLHASMRAQADKELGDAALRLAEMQRKNDELESAASDHTLHLDESRCAGRDEALKANTAAIMELRARLADSCAEAANSLSDLNLAHARVAALEADRESHLAIQESQAHVAGEWMAAQEALAGAKREKEKLAVLLKQRESQLVRLEHDRISTVSQAQRDIESALAREADRERAWRDVAAQCRELQDSLRAVSFERDALASSLESEKESLQRTQTELREALVVQESQRSELIDRDRVISTLETELILERKLHRDATLMIEALQAQVASQAESLVSQSFVADQGALQARQQIHQLTLQQSKLSFEGNQLRSEVVQLHQKLEEKCTQCNLVQNRLDLASASLAALERDNLALASTAALHASQRLEEVARRESIAADYSALDQRHRALQGYAELVSAQSVRLHSTLENEGLALKNSSSHSRNLLRDLAQSRANSDLLSSRLQTLLSSTSALDPSTGHLLPLSIAPEVFLALVEEHRKLQRDYVDLHQDMEAAVLRDHARKQGLFAMEQQQLQQQQQLQLQQQQFAKTAGPVPFSPSLNPWQPQLDVWKSVDSGVRIQQAQYDAPGTISASSLPLSFEQLDQSPVKQQSRTTTATASATPGAGLRDPRGSPFAASPSTAAGRSSTPGAGALLSTLPLSSSASSALQLAGLRPRLVFVRQRLSIARREQQEARAAIGELLASTFSAMHTDLRGALQLMAQRIINLQAAATAAANTKSQPTAARA